jgi:O-antigen ligase
VVSPATPFRSLRTLDSIVFYGTFSVLLLGPLAFGTVEPWSIFSLETITALLLLIWICRQVADGRIQVKHNPLFAPMSAFALLVGIQIALRISAYPYDTVSTARLYCAYGILVFLAMQSLQRTSQVNRLGWGFCGYGLALALFGLIQGLASNGKIYWLRTPDLGGWIYGPYVNHNHYAGLMEMLFPIPLVMALSGTVPRKWRLLPASAAVLMATTIFLSGSRGGMIAFLGQMVALGILLALQKSRRNALTIGGVLLVIGVLILWVGGQGLVDRMISIRSEATTELSGGLRLTVDRDALKMFTHKPVLGWGLRAFPVAYPQFRSFFTNLFINEAHNDYLQALVETGLLGFGIVVWFLVLVYREGTRKLKNWGWNLNGAVALAALLGCTGILIHSLIDFNLQIPANAALFYVLCATAAADTRFGMHRHRHSRHAKAAEPLAGA